MKIVSYSKYRWEYCYDGGKRWRLLTECVGLPIEVKSLREAHDLLTPGHPGLEGCVDIFMNTRQRVDFVPWEPFAPSADLIDAFGSYIVETIRGKTRQCTVTGDVWFWVHEFGDSA